MPATVRTRRSAWREVERGVHREPFSREERARKARRTARSGRQREEERAVRKKMSESKQAWRQRAQQHHRRSRSLKRTNRPTPFQCVFNVRHRAVIGDESASHTRSFTAQAPFRNTDHQHGKIETPLLRKPRVVEFRLVDITVIDVRGQGALKVLHGAYQVPFRTHSSLVGKRHRFVDDRQRHQRGQLQLEQRNTNLA